MIKLFIPSIGTKLKLVSDWEFDFYAAERRNSALAEKLNVKVVPYSKQSYNAYINQLQKITLPKDTVLQVDRIYIKQGQEAYNSVSFKILECPLPLLKFVKGKQKGRFWAKLHDINTIECELIND